MSEVVGVLCYCFIYDLIGIKTFFQTLFSFSFFLRFTARITELIQVLDELNVGKYQRTMVSDSNHKVSDKSTIEFKPGSGRLVIQDHLIRYILRVLTLLLLLYPPQTLFVVEYTVSLCLSVHPSMCSSIRDTLVFF